MWQQFIFAYVRETKNGPFLIAKLFRRRDYFVVQNNLWCCANVAISKFPSFCAMTTDNLSCKFKLSCWPHVGIFCGLGCWPNIHFKLITICTNLYFSQHFVFWQLWRYTVEIYYFKMSPDERYKSNFMRFPDLHWGKFRKFYFHS